MKTTILIFFSLLILQVVSQACSGKAEKSVYCKDHGACTEEGQCSCYSGYYGHICQHEIAVEQPNCKWHTNTFMRTDYYPTMEPESMFFKNDILHMSVKAPLVVGRLEMSIFIQNETYAQCKYPGNYTENYFDNTGDCFNRFNYVLPWITGKECGWYRDDSVDELTYYGNMYIWQREELGQIRGKEIIRYIKRVIPLGVKFQTRVAISTTIKVASPVNMFSAVVKQEYIEESPKRGRFEFITSLQYPFKLDITNTEVDEYPAGLKTKLSEITIPSECPTDKPCTQTFAMDLTVADACSFTGTYKMKFKLKCHPSILTDADCPLGSNRDVEIQISANSENFCTKVQVNIELSGTLKAYEEETHINRKDAFLLGQTSYFKGEVTSPKATLKETTVVRVHWQQGNLTKVLFDESKITTEGTLEKFAVGAFSSNTASFKFDLSKEWMNIPVDSNSDFQVVAVLQVKYQSIDGTQEISYSNMILPKDIYQTQTISIPGESGDQDSKFSEKIKIFGEYEQKKDNSSSTFTLSINMVLCIIIILLF